MGACGSLTIQLLLVFIFAVLQKPLCWGRAGPGVRLRSTPWLFVLPSPLCSALLKEIYFFFCPVSILALLLQSASLVRKGCLGSLADCLLPLGWPSSSGWAPAAASCGGQPWERAARATFTARSQTSMGAWPESCEACTRAEPVHPSLPPSTWPQTGSGNEQQGGIQTPLGETSSWSGTGAAKKCCS